WTCRCATGETLIGPGKLPIGPDDAGAGCRKLGPSMTTLRTERLILRRWRPGDRAPFAAMNADPVVMAHFVAPLTRDQSDAFVDAIESSFDELGYGFWALEERS